MKTLFTALLISLSFSPAFAQSLTGGNGPSNNGNEGLFSFVVSSNSNSTCWFTLERVDEMLKVFETFRGEITASKQITFSSNAGDISKGKYANLYVTCTDPEATLTLETHKKISNNVSIVTASSGKGGTMLSEHG